MSLEMELINDHGFNQLKALFLNEFTSMQTEVTLFKNETSDLKIKLNALQDENRRLKKDLIDMLENQLQYNDDSLSNKLGENGQIQSGIDVVSNLETQLIMTKTERENLMRMWQESLSRISKLEKENENLRLQSAPSVLNYQLQMNHVQEELAKVEATYLNEINSMKFELNRKNDEIASLNIQCNECKIQIENFKSQIQEKNIEKREMYKKEFGYDDALVSLQNMIDELETKSLVQAKENELLKEQRRQAEMRISDLARKREEVEFKSRQIEIKAEDYMQAIQTIKLDVQRSELVERKLKEDNQLLHNAMLQLMQEAAEKTKQEIQSLKSIYNINLEKLLSEYNALELDNSEKSLEIEKLRRSKKSVEQELERLSEDNLRSTSRDNVSYDDLYRRFCLCEREKDAAQKKLDSRETELKHLQKLYDTEKTDLNKLVHELTKKADKLSYELEKSNEERLQLVNKIDECKTKMSEITLDKDHIQKKLTKYMSVNEHDLENTRSEFNLKISAMEKTHCESMFELRQLLNMQQRMSNKWKEECHSITTQSEQKLSEMKKSLDNLRIYNEGLLGDLQEAKRKEYEFEKSITNYDMKVKTLENRLKDAELQATEATKRMAKQLAKERIILYEKNLLENDLERNRFQDTYRG